MRCRRCSAHGAGWINAGGHSALGATARPTRAPRSRCRRAIWKMRSAARRLYHFHAAIEEFDASGTRSAADQSETYANDSLNGIELPPQPYPVPALQIGAGAALQRDPRDREDGAAHRPQHHAVFQGGLVVAVARGARDSAGALHHRRAVQRHRRCQPDGAAAQLRGEPGAGLLRQLDDPAVHHSAGGRRAAHGIIDPAADQQSLLAYQQASFLPPQSTIALPTRGVLGEAVLGHCSSAEKIDLTRFWNWQDSPVGYGADDLAGHRCRPPRRRSRQA